MTQVRDYCRWNNFPIRACLEPLLLRFCYYNWRRWGERTYVRRTYDHVLEATNWRAKMFPLRDTDADIRELLGRGIMYWVGRDTSLRPLLVVRLKRLPPSTSPQRFKRLIVFCFEWALRYLFVPGLVETCCVLFDVRGIAIHSFPLSALSDVINTLTVQYPFRLHRMIILNDSLFIQTVWSIAKQFLTEVQQEKVAFVRNGPPMKTLLLGLYAAHQLEEEFGGTRPEVTAYYPFPLAPGPFELGSKGPRPNAIRECHRAVAPVTAIGKLWTSPGGTGPPLIWSAEAPKIFGTCGLPPPAHWDRTPHAHGGVTATVTETKSREEEEEVEPASQHSETASRQDSTSVAVAVGRGFETTTREGSRAPASMEHGQSLTMMECPIRDSDDVFPRDIAAVSAGSSLEGHLARQSGATTQSDQWRSERPPDDSLALRDLLADGREAKQDCGVSGPPRNICKRRATPAVVPLHLGTRGCHHGATTPRNGSSPNDVPLGRRFWYYCRCRSKPSIRTTSPPVS